MHVLDEEYAKERIFFNFFLDLLKGDARFALLKALLGEVVETVHEHGVLVDSDGGQLALDGGDCDLLGRDGLREAWGAVVARRGLGRLRPWREVLTLKSYCVLDMFIK